MSAETPGTITPDLRQCPFCSNDRLKIVHSDGGRAVFVMCSECGATGPSATGGDPPRHAEQLWNQRQGVGVTIGRGRPLPGYAGRATALQSASGAADAALVSSTK